MNRLPTEARPDRRRLLITTTIAAAIGMVAGGSLTEGLRALWTSPARRERSEFEALTDPIAAAERLSRLASARVSVAQRAGYELGDDQSVTLSVPGRLDFVRIATGSRLVDIESIRPSRGSTTIQANSRTDEGRHVVRVLRTEQTVANTVPEQVWEIVTDRSGQGTITALKGENAGHVVHTPDAGALALATLRDAFDILQTV